MYRRLCVVLLAVLAGIGIAEFAVKAAVSVTLSLPDDATGLVRRQCGRDTKGGTLCTAAEGTAWLQARVDTVILNDIRQREQTLTSQPNTVCILFNAASQEKKDEACVSAGLQAGCTPPQCQ